LSREKSFSDRLWDFFCSLKLAIVTLILLALTSIIGTIIEQNLPPQEYMQ
jgi:cytochrome c biogenesis protein